MPEEITDESEAAERIGTFLSPEGIIMMSLAIFLDGSEFLVNYIPVIGQTISVIIDIIALLFIGGWMLFRSGIIRAPKRVTARVGKAVKWAQRLKWLRPLFIVIEFIPIVGSILPLWVVVVYLELKYA